MNSATIRPAAVQLCKGDHYPGSFPETKPGFKPATGLGVFVLAVALACGMVCPVAADDAPGNAEGHAGAKPANTNAPRKAGELAAADQAVVAAAIERLKRDLLLECLLSPSDKKALDKKPASADKRKGVQKDDPALEPDRDKRLAMALLQAEKRGKVSPNLAKQFSHGLGEETLIGLALVKAGVPTNHPLIRQIWEDLQRDRCNTTYGAGVGLMLVEAMLHSPSGDPWPQDEPEKKKVTAWVNRVAGELASLGHNGGWSYGSRAYHDHDHSNTQYAALGLKAARLCGWEPKGNATTTIWKPMLEHFLKAQERRGPQTQLIVEVEKDGLSGVDYTSNAWQRSASQANGYEATAEARGWDYKTDDRSNSGPPSASLNMTIAGLTAIILAWTELNAAAKEETKEAAKDTKHKSRGYSADLALRDGMAWVQANWPKNAGDGYGLYGIERLGVLGNLTTIGGHDWYRELAPGLAAKVMDGKLAKSGPASIQCEKAFYLLFLVRGTSSAYVRSASQDVKP